MKRGDLVTVALQGAQREPRPALVIRADDFSGVPALTVLPITSTRVDAPLLRIDVTPTSLNGLTKPSQVMVDKVQTPPRDKVGPAIGQLEATTMLDVDRALAVFFGLA